MWRHVRRMTTGNAAVTRATGALKGRVRILAAPMAKDGEDVLKVRSVKGIADVIKKQGRKRDTDWTCSSCHFYNRQEELSCAMCNNGQEMDRFEALGKVVYAGAWRCLNCGYGCSRLISQCPECKTKKGNTEPRHKGQGEAQAPLPPKRTIVDDLREMSDYDSNTETEFEFMKGEKFDSDSDAEAELAAKRKQEEEERLASYREPLQVKEIVEALRHFNSADPVTRYCGICGFKVDRPCDTATCENKKTVRPLPCYCCLSPDHVLTDCPQVSQALKTAQQNQ